MKKIRLIIIFISFFSMMSLALSNVAFAGDNKGTEVLFYVKADVKFVNELAGKEVVEQYDLDELIEEPQVIMIAGYDFDGWFLADGTKWNFKTDKVADHTTLYAKYTLRNIPVTGIFENITIIKYVLCILIALLIILIIINRFYKFREEEKK